MLQNKSHKTSKESGNVFVIILVAIVLFSALSFTISRGLRSDTTEQMSGQRVTLSASTILNSAQILERGVNKLRRKSVSENDISFDQDFEAGYEHTPTQPDNHKIFDVTGGTISWQRPPENASDNSPWFFTGSTCIQDLGNGGSGCDSDSTSNEELIAALPGLFESVCEEINDRLGISGIPADTGGGISTTQFTGTFADDTEIILAGGPFPSACFSNGGTYIFYHVLLER